MIGVFSTRMSRIPHLDRVLGAPVRRVWPFTTAKLTAVAGWGQKKTALRARRYAERHGLPYLTVEDGFLRSIGLGRDTPPVSLVVDDLGIFFDARAPSRLETLIAAPADAGTLASGAQLAAAWRENRVSKYNHQPDGPRPVAGPFVLVADQTYGDASIEGGLASPAQFQRMLDAALDEHADKTVVLKIHPEVMAGHKRGYFSLDTLPDTERLVVMATECHPAGLLAAADAVYTVTSQIGFEALIWGKPVRTFGMPFYAGWGLTGDDIHRPARRQNVGLDHLIHAALAQYPTYIHPDTGADWTATDAIAWIGTQRTARTPPSPQPA
ncbi:capsular biosynthesis protein [Stappia sp.]|uniref:capsular polysaccharide export protein, LipB/KpsS family n=1 Tax=Stappia sp. TaxID=1870903 RepID=UPI0032D8BFDA